MKAAELGTRSRAGQAQARHALCQDHAGGPAPAPLLAAEWDTRIETLVAEALNLSFEQYGKSPVA